MIIKKLNLDYEQIDITGFETTNPYTLGNQLNEALEKGDLQNAKKIKNELNQLIQKINDKVTELKSKIQDVLEHNNLLLAKIQNFNDKINMFNPQEGDKLISFLPDVDEISARCASLQSDLETLLAELEDIGEKSVNQILNEGRTDKTKKLSSILSDLDDLVSDHTNREHELEGIIKEFIEILRVQVRLLNFESYLYGDRSVVLLPIFQVKKRETAKEFIYNFDQKWVSDVIELSKSLAAERVKLKQHRVKKYVLSYFKETLKVPEYYKQSSLKVDPSKVLRHVRTWEPDAKDTEILDILRMWSGDIIKEEFSINLTKIGLEPKEIIEEERGEVSTASI